MLNPANGGFDPIVDDEAHRCAGPAGGVFATMLDDELLPARRRLFMTAAPRVPQRVCARRPRTSRSRSPRWTARPASGVFSTA
jgi:predicted helicase